MDILNKYKNIIQKLNFDFENWDFDIDKNENLVWTIMNIYKKCKSRNYKEVAKLIDSIDILWSWNINIIPKTRDWDFKENDDNIEAFNSIEIISALFLKNLQDNLWETK